MGNYPSERRSAEVLNHHAAGSPIGRTTQELRAARHMRADPQNACLLSAVKLSQSEHGLPVIYPWAIAMVLQLMSAIRQGPAFDDSNTHNPAIDDCNLITGNNCNALQSIAMAIG